MSNGILKNYEARDLARDLARNHPDWNRNDAYHRHFASWAKSRGGSENGSSDAWAEGWAEGLAAIAKAESTSA
jgi:hypothetical protein